jgi:hypothetical protein
MFLLEVQKGADISQVWSQGCHPQFYTEENSGQTRQNTVFLVLCGAMAIAVAIIPNPHNTFQGK